jgi:four helix bundle protein
MNDESTKDLKHRTKGFALRVIRLFSALPKSAEAQVIGKQILRSGTSVGAPYREACRARSNAEFVSKMQSGLQELDETIYWLELLAESNVVKPERLRNLQDEANQLTAIFVASVKPRKRGTVSE